MGGWGLGVAGGINLVNTKVDEEELNVTARDGKALGLRRQGRSHFYFQG